MRRRSDVAPGFTLVEILVALAIFSTILVLLVSTFTGAARTREMMTERSRSFRQTGMTLDRIGSDLQGAVSAIRLTGQDGGPDTSLTSKSDTFSNQTASTLSLTAFTLPEESSARPATDLVKVKYFPKISADGAFFDLYREQSDLPLLENRLANREVRMARHLTGFRIELFDGTTWQTEWPPGPEKKGTLPKVVAVTLVDERGDAFRREIPLPLAGQETTEFNSYKRTKSP
jgi:general secretion pathway protein J